MLKDHFQLTRTPTRNHQLSSESLVAVLYAVAFVTGILDATSKSLPPQSNYLIVNLNFCSCTIAYASFSTFASNQTGNVVLLTIGIANALVLDLRNTAVSLVSYLLTGFIGGQIANKVGARTRWLLVLSMSTQILLLVIPTIIVSSFHIPFLLLTLIDLLHSSSFSPISSLLFQNQINGNS